MKLPVGTVASTIGRLAPGDLFYPSNAEGPTLTCLWRRHSPTLAEDGSDQCDLGFLVGGSVRSVTVVTWGGVVVPTWEA